MGTLENWPALISGANSLQELEDARQQFLGKKGLLTLAMKDLSTLSIEEKKEQGQKLNIIRENFQNTYNKKKSFFEDDLLNQTLNAQYVDLTLPVRPETFGKRHLLSAVSDEITTYFSNLGFVLQHAPDIDIEENNFDALNIPKTHPARQSQDTFYLENDLSMLLRTQTSNTQIHTMKNSKPPFRCMSLGRCYRNDAIDATHAPMFHQLEIFSVEKNITMAHLKTTIMQFLRHFFSDETLKIRFRPSFFPFTAPSAEVDIMTENKGWLEVLGCGLIHPNVLNNCSIDPNEYSGFAAGMGIERLTMLKYGIKDIRLLFENDQRFLKAFGS
jgi:phenylalanyl-tRNA synthetase alpha chain